MDEMEDIVDILETCADWSAIDGCKHQVRALIADWRRLRKENKQLWLVVDPSEVEAL